MTAEKESSDDALAQELAVMELVVQGVKDVVIAQRLDISLITVRRRASRFRKRLGAQTRYQAIAIAASRGLLSVPNEPAGTPEARDIDGRD